MRSAKPLRTCSPRPLKKCILSLNHLVSALQWTPLNFQVNQAQHSLQSTHTHKHKHTHTERARTCSDDVLEQRELLPRQRQVRPVLPFSLQIRPCNDHAHSSMNLTLLPQHDCRHILGRRSSMRWRKFLEQRPTSELVFTSQLIVAQIFCALACRGAFVQCFAGSVACCVTVRVHGASVKLIHQETDTLSQVCFPCSDTW